MSVNGTALFTQLLLSILDIIGRRIITVNDDCIIIERFKQQFSLMLVSMNIPNIFENVSHCRQNFLLIAASSSCYPSSVPTEIVFPHFWHTSKRRLHRRLLRTHKIPFYLYNANKYQYRNSFQRSSVLLSSLFYFDCLRITRSRHKRWRCGIRAF